MADDRTPRAATTRENKARQRQWVQPDLLPEPDMVPGYTYRWVRVSTLGTADPRNISSKLREGWEPVTLEEQPKFRILVDPQSRFREHIEVGGLLLCKTPHDLVGQRDAFYARQTSQQMEAVDNNFMSQSDPRMPLFKEARQEVSFGSGS